jgi:hypothetical protein
MASRCNGFAYQQESTMTNVSIEENVVMHTMAFFMARYVPVQAAVTTA